MGTRNRKARLALLLPLIVLASPAIAATPFIERIDGAGVRFADSKKNFDSVVQESLFVNFTTPWRWVSERNTSATIRLTLDVGRLRDEEMQRAFTSFGPTVRIMRERSRVPLFLDLGLSPTIIDGVKYGEEDLGTSFNFTSHIGIGLMLGPSRRHEIKLRFQHTSNGGIDETNPGVDMLGFDYVFRLSAR